MFNTGMHWAYGIDGRRKVISMSITDSTLTKSESAYEHPQRMPASSKASATTCERGGIMDLWVREARLFKYGSGTARISRRCVVAPKRSRVAASRRA